MHRGWRRLRTGNPGNLPPAQAPAGLRLSRGEGDPFATSLWAEPGATDFPVCAGQNGVAVHPLWHEGCE